MKILKIFFWKFYEKIFFWKFLEIFWKNFWNFFLKIFWKFFMSLTTREVISITFPHGMREVMGISSRMVPQQIGNGNYLPRDAIVNLRFPSSNVYYESVCTVPYVLNFCTIVRGHRVQMFSNVNIICFAESHSNFGKFWTIH